MDEITWNHAGEIKQGIVSRQRDKYTFEVICHDDGRMYIVHRKVITKGVLPDDSNDAYERAMGII